MLKGNDFYCTYCGKDFGENLIGLAKHMKTHDPAQR